MITQIDLKNNFHYDPDTGIFSRIKYLDKKSRLRGIRKVGTVSLGYLSICYRYKKYQAHRLAWLYMTGHFPDNYIDHIDGNKLNNSFSNLRKATKSENNQNRRKHVANSKTGFLGVYLRELNKNGNRYSKPYKAMINDKYIGCYATKEEAFSAYVEHKRRLHPFCTL